MTDFDEQLSRHFRQQSDDQSDNIKLTDPGVNFIMETGTRRIRKRRRLMVVSGVAAAALVVGGVAALTSSRNTKPSIASKPAANLSDAIEAAPAIRVDPMFDWTIEEGDAASTPYSCCDQSQWKSANDSYMLSTIPGKGQNFNKQAVYHTADGIKWTVASTQPLKDLWLSDVQNGPGQQVYAIGTAPGAKKSDVQFVSAISNDGGATFDSSPFPIDSVTMRKELGNLGLSGQIASNGKIAVAAISGGYSDPTKLVPDGVDISNGVLMGADGIQVFGPVTDLKAAGKDVCPAGWELKKGPPTFFIQTSGPGPEGVVVAVPSTAVGPGGFGQDPFHCTDPNQAADDMYVDASQVHGPVAQTIPFDKLGLSADSLSIVRQEPLVFTSADGTTWDRAALPAEARGSLSAVVGGDGGFAMTLYAFDQTTLTQKLVTLTSRDGSTWHEAKLPSTLIGSPPSVDANGSLVSLSSTGIDLLYATSSDGVQWTMTSLNGLLGADKSIRSYIERTAVGPAGTMLLVDAYRDPLAAKGGVEMRHGDLIIKMLDQNRNMELRDNSGTVLDTFSSNFGSSANGHIRQSNNGINIVDPETEDVLTSFTYQELDTAMNSALSQDQLNQPQQQVRYVLSTIDGKNWAAERLDELGLRLGQNSTPASTFAGKDSLSFSFITQVCCDPKAEPIPPAILVGKPIK